MSAKTDDLIKRFLLGELSEQERSQVEERFLADNEFFEEVLAAEDALIDQYLHNQLSGERMERAKTLFQSSLLQKRGVEFTQELIALMREANSELKRTTADVTQATFIETTDRIHPGEETAEADAEAESPAGEFPPIPPGLKNFVPRFTAISWLFISLVCVSLLAWMGYLYYQTRSREAPPAALERASQEARKKPSEIIQSRPEQSRPLEAEKESRATAEELSAKSKIRRPEAIIKPRSITSILLTPATLERGGGNSKTIRLKAESKRIQLQLQLGEGQRYSRYSAFITTFDGHRVWNNDSIDASQIKQRRLSLIFPSSLLENEDYRIELKGLLDNGDFVHVADYIFKVRK